MTQLISRRGHRSRVSTAGLTQFLSQIFLIIVIFLLALSHDKNRFSAWGVRHVYY